MCASDGEISMKRPRTIMVDLDGVICSEERTFERALAKPLDGARESIRKLRADGHTVIIYTARGWAEFRVTKQWLDDNGIEHDGLHMGKPIAEIWIDDRAVRHSSWTETNAMLDKLL
jgi:hypothetical protein